MSDYPWWDEVDANTLLMQGDLIESCPVSVFRPGLQVDEAETLEGLLLALQGGVGIELVRAIVMTQACDLEQRKVRNAILCPAPSVEDFQRDWEEAYRAKHGQPPRGSAWSGYLKQIRDGRLWNLTLLRKRELGQGVNLVAPTTIVDFHEVFSLPVDFLELWLRKSGQPRLRLLPPYREHLSQAFARFFMRVGLPLDIEL